MSWPCCLHLGHDVGHRLGDFGLRLALADELVHGALHVALHVQNVAAHLAVNRRCLGLRYLHDDVDGERRGLLWVDLCLATDVLHHLV